MGDEAIFGADRVVLVGTARVRFERFDLPAIIERIGGLVIVDGARSFHITSVRPVDERELELDLMGSVEIEPARLSADRWEVVCHDGRQPERVLTDDLEDLLSAPQREQLRAIDATAAERFERVKIADSLRLLRPMAFDEGFELLEMQVSRQAVTIEARDLDP